MYRDTVSLGVNRAGTYSFVGLNTVPGPPLDDVLAVLPALLSDEEHPPGSHDKGDSSDGEGGGGEAVEVARERPTAHLTLTILLLLTYLRLYDLVQPYVLFFVFVLFSSWGVLRARVCWRAYIL